MPRKPRYQPQTEEAFATVIKDYMASAPKWQSKYSDRTKNAWKRELDLAARPEILGAIPITEIRPSLVQAFLDGLAHKAGKQMNALTALKQLEKWAIVRERLPRPITLGCEVMGSSALGGHKPWSDEQVNLAERHARAEISRAITLAANTGQRCSDLVKMRWQDLEPYQGQPGIKVTTQKTKRELWIPLTEELLRTTSKWERRPGFILLGTLGKPWSANALSSAWAHERAGNEALASLKDAGLVLHGLRATACVRLSRLGCSSLQIAQTVGMSEEMVTHYLRFSSQKENAMAAVVRLDTRNRGAKPLIYK